MDLSQEGYKRLLYEKTERLKELEAINRTTDILKQEKTVDELLQKVCDILPPAWQYPESTVVRICYSGNEYMSSGFKETEWSQKKGFYTLDDKEGSIEVFYLKEFPVCDEGPFLKEERNLINNIASLINGALNTIIGKAILHNTEVKEKKPPFEYQVSREFDSAKHRLLQKFLKKHNSDRDVYHDLMTFKVREILLVATLYDAYIIEKEGRFYEKVAGEYYQLNLASVPRITGVSSPEEALENMQFKHYDLVIIMMGVDKSTPVKLSQIIRQIYPKIPVLLLLNNNSDIALFEGGGKKLRSFDKVFVWNGDSKVFLAMVKFIEDKFNVENDTHVGMTNVILLVEDSAKYYSRYLPLLYSIVMEQTQLLIEDVTNDELYKILRMHARPKILLVSNYEEAVDIINRYREFLLCVITDVKFERAGKLDNAAGLELVKFAKEQIPDIPTVIQSSDEENAGSAYALKSVFINKNSDVLIQEIKSFIHYYLGFGNFIFRDSEGREIATARTMAEFEERLKTIPEESLVYHGSRNHFSHWLMARGEIQLAKKLKPIKVKDFRNFQDLRDSVLSMIKESLVSRDKGKIVNFDEASIADETTIVSFAAGSLGGKGRGLSFINTLINNFEFEEVIPDILVRTPKTSIIGTEEFELFLERNKLSELIYPERDYSKIKELFINANLSDGLVKKLRRYLKIIRKPIAVRSSSLFEDSLMQPFAGIFDTYLLPNNHPDTEMRLHQLMNAIKLVFASIFSPTARAYFEAINYKIEEEKMAVILQEVVGEQYEDCFYPHISGVAQSYNFYPFSHMKPEEGFAVAALGLGKYVVEGEKTYRFSPKYPTLQLNSPKEQYKESQLYFFAVDLKKKNPDLIEGEDAGLIRLDIDVAEKHGNLTHLASVYDIENETISPGTTDPGPRIINFANILKFDYIPLAKTIEVILDIVKEALGSPVEIEFAVDLNKNKDGKASFHLLQIKPLIGNVNDYEINTKDLDRNDLLLYTEKGMGNGVIDSITDVIYVNRSAFDKMSTIEMSAEIEKLNRKMIDKNAKYILIGPGRWGTRDRFLGIPVTWPQISNAQIIVEVSLEDFLVDASLGSHFFHNVISMNVGYFSVHHDSNDFVDWDLLDQQPLVEETKYFRHARFKDPLSIVMDGKKRISVIKYR